MLLPGLCRSSRSVACAAYSLALGWKQQAVLNCCSFFRAGGEGGATGRLMQENASFGMMTVALMLYPTLGQRMHYAFDQSTLPSQACLHTRYNQRHQVKPIASWLQFAGLWHSACVLDVSIPPTELYWFTHCVNFMWQANTSHTARCFHRALFKCSGIHVWVGPTCLTMHQFAIMLMGDYICLVDAWHEASCATCARQKLLWYIPHEGRRPGGQSC